MRIALMVLLAVVLLETAALVLLGVRLARKKRETGVLLPVDVLPLRFATKDDGWDVVDDVIQYEDDQRAEFYRWEAGL